MLSSAGHSNFRLGQAAIWRRTSAHNANVKMLCPYQIPLASGQSRAIPAQVSKGDTGLSNRKWSCRPKGTKQKEEIDEIRHNGKHQVINFQLTNNGCGLSGSASQHWLPTIITESLKYSNAQFPSLRILTCYWVQPGHQLFSGDSSVQLRLQTTGLAQMEILNHYGVCLPHQHQPHAMAEWAVSEGCYPEKCSIQLHSPCY